MSKGGKSRSGSGGGKKSAAAQAAASQAGTSGGVRAAAHEPEVGVLMILREWSDALVIAFVLAMFVRVFILELFKIPTGSMTPTLLGDFVAEVDLDSDSDDDLVVFGGGEPSGLRGSTYAFENVGARYEFSQEMTEHGFTDADVRRWENDRIIIPEYDRILVSKFAYWRKNPERGDVIVFKVPEIIWDPDKPIYIKRAAGLPGETINIDGRLRTGGELVEAPEFFTWQKYVPLIGRMSPGAGEQPYIEYSETTPRSSQLMLGDIQVPEDGVFALGDHTRSSLDSRYWGAVPLINLKGKAFIRYWPARKIKFIR